MGDAARGKIVFFNKRMERTADGSGYGRAVDVRSDGASRRREAGGHRLPHPIDRYGPRPPAAHGRPRLREGSAEDPGRGALGSRRRDARAHRPRRQAGPRPLPPDVRRRTGCRGRERRRRDPRAAPPRRRSSSRQRTSTPGTSARARSTTARAAGSCSKRGGSSRSSGGGPREPSASSSSRTRSTGSPAARRTARRTSPSFRSTWPRSRRTAAPGARPGSPGWPARPSPDARLRDRGDPGAARRRRAQRRRFRAAPTFRPCADGVPQFSIRQDSSRYFDWHHTANDTFDKIEPEKMDRNAAAVAAFAWIAASTEHRFREDPAGIRNGPGRAGEEGREEQTGAAHRRSSSRRRIRPGGGGARRPAGSARQRRQETRLPAAWTRPPRSGSRDSRWPASTASTRTSPSTSSTAPRTPKPPRAFHPAFFGCYDWHSSVHGHWMLVRLLETFTRISLAAEDPRFSASTSPRRRSPRRSLYSTARARARSSVRMGGRGCAAGAGARRAGPRDRGSPPGAERLRPSGRRGRLARLPTTFQAEPRAYRRPPEHRILAEAIDYARAGRDAPIRRKALERAAATFRRGPRLPPRLRAVRRGLLLSVSGEGDLMRRVLAPAPFADWLGEFLPGPDGRNGCHGLSSEARRRDRSDGPEAGASRRAQPLAGMGLDGISRSLPRIRPAPRGLARAAGARAGRARVCRRAL